MYLFISVCLVSMVGDRGGGGVTRPFGHVIMRLPSFFFGIWSRFQLYLCFLVIWSQLAGLGGSEVGAAAWSASGSAAGLPVVGGG